MLFCKTALLFVPILGVLSRSSNGIGESINKFAFNLLKATSAEAGDLNIALSPYTVWTLLSIISEGARGNTAKELNYGLNIPSDKTQFRNDFKALSSVLSSLTPGVTLELSNGIFTNKKHALKEDFQNITKEYYNVDLLPVDFKNLKGTTEFINNYVAKATNNRIRDLIAPDDLRYAEIFLTSTLYFKGAWTSPFNKSATKKESFYNDKNEKIGEVDMMNIKTASIPFIRLDSIKSQAASLSYGKDEKMAMIVILPFRGSNVDEVLNLLDSYTIETVIEKLNSAKEMFFEEELEVSLPRFSVTSDFNLNIPLQQMGIQDIFDSQKADLLGMFKHYLYISRLIQKAEIEVNEEGTVASAAAAASAIYKMPAPKFIANRPFIYAIINVNTNSVIFEGIVRNPNF